jgi:hypothetical protein
LKENNQYRINVYVGRTKTWQVLSDTLPKDQIDKVQAAITAPLSDQLDEWENENQNKHLQCPLNNENVHKFRDAPDYKDNLDHDYERILYERQRNQTYEQMRNMRYGELLDKYYNNMISYH